MIGSIISGVLLFLCFPQFEIFPLAFFALVPLLLTLYRIKNSVFKAFFLSFLTGFIFFAGLLFWVIKIKRIGVMGIPAWILLSGFEALYFGVFGVFAFLGNKFLSKREKILFIPSLFVLLEYLRCKGFLGFPWGVLGYSQAKNIYFIQIAEFSGVYGISFLIVLFNNFLAEEKKNLKEIFSIISVFLIVFTYGILLSFKKLPERNVKIALIQGNLEKDIEWSEETLENTFLEYEKISNRAKESQIVVWPERIVPVSITDYKIFERIKKISYSLGNVLVIGCTDNNLKGEYFNAVAVFEKGELLGKYYKTKLVPFGEVIPFKKFFQKINYNPWGELNNWIDDTPGKNFNPVKTPFLNLGFNICYETAFPEISRKIVKNGAELLIGVVADSWFGKIESLQHTKMFVFRAVENRTYLLRCADIGITCVIDPYGRIEKSLPLFQQGVLKAAVSKKIKNTFYTQYGDLFVILCSLISLACIFKFLYLAKIKSIKWKKKDEKTKIFAFLSFFFSFSPHNLFIFLIFKT